MMQKFKSNLVYDNQLLFIIIIRKKTISKCQLFPAIYFCHNFCLW